MLGRAYHSRVGDNGREPRAAWRASLQQIIFEADTPAGKTFDVALLVVILLSVISVILESVAAVQAAYGPWLHATEWVITGLFTAEFGLRLVCVTQPLRYVRSFFGIVDLLAILPTYLSLLFTGTHSLLVIRALRLLRVFRVFKLARYLVETNVLVTALRSSLPKVIIFMATIVVLVVIMGAAMYLVEGPESGFTSIPRSMYWAVVTMTTVGYGDIAPQSIGGQCLAALTMLMGYSIIAVPTGIVSAEIVHAHRGPVTTSVCPICLSEGHDFGARFCKQCGANLAERLETAG
jgi:voltage-gated potassium channel